MFIKNYFNENAGLFAALALFTFLMVDTLSTHLILSFVSYFFVFLLLSYLFWNMDLPKSGWEGLLLIGYFLFFLSLLEFGNEYNSILSNAPGIIFYIPTLFFIASIIKMFYQLCKKKTYTPPSYNQ